MELGISLASASSLPPAEAADHLVARARAAASAELDSLSLGDAHAVGSRTYVQNVPALGRLLAEWRGRPAGCLFLLPLWSPVLVAEQVATLAAIHDGQFIIQTGIGGTRHEHAAMERPSDHRVSGFVESVQVIDALLRGESVSSERFGFADVSVGSTPIGEVDWWMGTMAPAGVRRAAHHGAAWYASPKVEVDEFRELDGIYRSECEEVGTRPRVMLRLDAVVLADGGRATALAFDAVAQGYRGMDVSHLLVGSPDQAIERLREWAALGVDQIVVRTMGLDPAVDLETIEAMAEVRRAVADEGAA